MSRLFTAKIGQLILRSEDDNYRVYFLGAEHQGGEKYKIKFSFERIGSKHFISPRSGDEYSYGHASSDIVTFYIEQDDMIMFAEYFGEYVKEEIIDEETGGKNEVNVFKHIDHIQNNKINQYEWEGNIIYQSEM